MSLILQPYDILFVCTPLWKLTISLNPFKIAVRTKLEKQKEERRIAKATANGVGETKKPSALDRFKRVS